MVPRPQERANSRPLALSTRAERATLAEVVAPRLGPCYDVSAMEQRGPEGVDALEERRRDSRERAALAEAVDEVVAGFMALLDARTLT